jgi:hypothetical protein
VRIIIVCALFTLSSFGQVDNLTRMGAILNSPDNNSTGVKAALNSLQHPVPQKMTEQQFRRVAASQLAGAWQISHDGTWSEKTRMQIVSPGRIERVDRIFAPNRLTVVQTLTNGLYLARFNDDTEMVAVALGRDGIADDEPIKERVAKTGKVYRYVSVRGATKTVPVYEPCAEPRDATIDECVARFKAGQAFQIIAVDKSACNKCDGKGIIASKRGTFNLREKCPTCGGNGSLNHNCVHSVSIE